MALLNNSFEKNNQDRPKNAPNSMQEAWSFDAFVETYNKLAKEKHVHTFVLGISETTQDFAARYASSDHKTIATFAYTALCAEQLNDMAGKYMGEADMKNASDFMRKARKLVDEE